MKCMAAANGIGASAAKQPWVLASAWREVGLSHVSGTTSGEESLLSTLLCIEREVCKSKGCAIRAGRSWARCKGFPKPRGFRDKIS